MNTALASERSLDRDEQYVHSDVASARIPLVDRLSLRVGLWLLLRSTRRIHRLRDHAGHEAARVAQRARDARDRLSPHHLARAHRA